MIVHDIFTKKQTIVTYSINELKQMYDDGTLKLKEVQQHQVREIKKYITENATGGHIFFPPLVANTEVGALLRDSKPTKLSIIDGTQRIKAFLQLEEFIAKALKSDNPVESKLGFKLRYVLSNTELALQLFEGLSQKEEDQLYIDLNTKGKKVSLSKRIAYDSRNEINRITNKVLQLNHQLLEAGVEMEKRAIIRPSNKKLLSLSQLRQLVEIFMTGGSGKKADEIKNKLNLNTEEFIQLINCWFELLFKLYPANKIGNYHETIFASYTMLKSLVVYANKGLEHESFDKRQKTMTERMKALSKINWKRTNKEWEQFKGARKGRDQYYYLTNDKENINKIVNWLEQQGR
ncbi:hypothetical protein MXL46_10125 [Heyndrickxia sporothermodurans]|uniref:Uncharacterized protein n=1 Tax=Heyndrickxia sporothermodurans TaxID=46224 RepID=A0A150KKH8_9BACI|nr:DNA sulfur modification protein DndB [Heyndrickxia sporothermodurans]KYC89948.1 hypothetical protein B4102_3955 [Heyndrickxia sporothermodurans]MBL5782254.1 hypothetical protein [Heyndrickxia sporothermodurans]MBL5794095.1 hypothetical protein [Heyndrickxia sporothermodurans]MBL5855107.1 hypothetical protein [Heyndrickxia sporothermodurans]MBL5866716.1 hypothetical protein [Heyndrickxia sporothermodurans]